jgi:hypothetical protein
MLRGEMTTLLHRVSPRAEYKGQAYFYKKNGYVYACLEKNLKETPETIITRDLHLRRGFGRKCLLY